ncbi:hypothetical protein FOA52_014291 [Chlamydomonas sp. UWO 241]|nr:hypothetical protein FOA52_014291 [Chlamydomonas sp. UWO 241]
MGRNQLHDALIHMAGADEVLALLAAHPAGAAEKDKAGRLPLHCALGAAEEDEDGETDNWPLHSAPRAASEVVFALLAAHPAGAAEKDEGGYLPLHIAVRSQAAPKVVSALLAAHPAGAVENTSNGRLPLHLAATNKASPEVVSALLAVHPAGAVEKDNAGDLPLNLAFTQRPSGCVGGPAPTPVMPELMSVLLAAHPAGAAEKDRNGNLPLHLALTNQAAPEVVLALLAAHPAGAAKRVWSYELPLHLAAAKQAAPEVVSALLAAHQAGAAEKDTDGNLPLHLALTNQAAPEVVSALLAAHPAGAAEKDTDGNLPLHLALTNQAAPEVVSALLAAHPAGVVENDKDGDQLLHLMMMHFTVCVTPEVVSSLLAAHPASAAEKHEYGDILLHLALRNKAAPEVVSALLAAHPAGAAEKNNNGHLPLHIAATDQAASEVVAALLTAHPAGAAEKNEVGDLPLHLAAANQAAPGVVSALLAAHPDGAWTRGAAEWGTEGWLPLHLAAAYQAAPEVVAALLAAYPDGAWMRGKDCQVPLHLAAANQAAPEVVCALLAADPDIAEVRDQGNRLPLHLAAANQAAPGVVSALLAAHPNGAAARDAPWALRTEWQFGDNGDNGDLPLHYAAANQAAPEVVSALLAAHPDGATEKDKNGSLPLHLAAAKKAAPEVVSALLAAHPDGATEKDKNGSLPLHLAAANKAAIDMHRMARAWHGVVKEEAFAAAVKQIVAADPSLADLADDYGATALDVAIGACRKAPDGAATLVALKLMRDKEAFLSEVVPRMRYKFGEEFVVGVMRVHVCRPAAPVAGSDSSAGKPSGSGGGGGSNASGDSSSGGGGIGPIGHSPRVAADGADVEALLARCEGAEGHIHEAGSFGKTGAVEGREPYTLCVVMLRGDRSLLDALQHDHFAGTNWLMVRAIARAVFQALLHMHSKGMVHGDVKPLNVMAFGTNWRMIDLDVARKIGDFYGDKAPSSGYCAPEVAAALLAAISAAGVSGALKGVKASVAADLWGAGVLLYFMAVACQLMMTDLNDDLGLEDLRKLASWSSSDRNSRLVDCRLTKTNPVVADLLMKLLEPNPAARLAHWGVCEGDSEGMACDRVLDHPFFKDNTEMVQSDIHLQMAAIHSAVLVVGSAVQGVGAKVDVVDGKVDAVDAKLDVVLQRMQAQTRMLSSILTEDRKVPSLMLFVPGGAGDEGLGWWNGAMRPGEWLQQEVRVYFVCAVSMKWDEASGFSLKFNKEWVLKAMPYIKVGLTILTIAAAAGRLAGFPIPNFVGNIGQLLEEQLGVLKTLTEGLGAAAAAGLKAVEAVTSAAWDSAVAGEDVPDILAARELLRKSCAEVRRLLSKEHPGWEDKTALECAVCKEDGLCEWVLPEYAKQFRLLGGKMLGAASKEQAPDPGAVQCAMQRVREAYAARLAAAELAALGAREREQHLLARQKLLARQAPDLGAAQRAMQELREAYEARLAASLAREQQLLARLEAGTGSSSRSGAAAAVVQQQAQAEEQDGQPGGCGGLFGMGDRRPRSTRVAPSLQASPNK